ncbi:MAG: hypothetical protein ACR2F6_13580 [Mycobacteriales bacterium]
MTHPAIRRSACPAKVLLLLDPLDYCASNCGIRAYAAARRAGDRPEAARPAASACGCIGTGPRLYNLTKWVETVKKLGAPGLHFHDLRHTGNLLAAQTGASTKDLMSRMGHDDMRAALIYTARRARPIGSSPTG